MGMRGLAGGKDGKVAPAGECHIEGMTRGSALVSGGKERPCGAERKQEMGFRETLGLKALEVETRKSVKIRANE